MTSLALSLNHNWLLRLHSPPGNKPAHSRLIISVLRILARANRLGKSGASLEDKKVTQGPEASPLDASLGPVARPHEQCEPESLLRDEIGMATPRPQSADHEAAVQVLGRELVFVLIWDARGLLVCVLCAVEIPLLLVGEVRDDNEAEGKARVGEIEEGEFGWCFGGLRQEKEGVCRGGD